MFYSFHKKYVKSIKCDKMAQYQRSTNVKLINLKLSIFLIMCDVRHSFISVIGVYISINNPTKIHERRIYTFFRIYLLVNLKIVSRKNSRRKIKGQQMKNIIQ